MAKYFQGVDEVFSGIWGDQYIILREQRPPPPLGASVFDWVVLIDWTKVSYFIVVDGPGTLSSKIVHVLSVLHIFESMFSLLLHSKTSPAGPHQRHNWITFNPQSKQKILWCKIYLINSSLSSPPATLSTVTCDKIIAVVTSVTWKNDCSRFVLLLKTCSSIVSRFIRKIFLGLCDGQCNV